MIRPGVLLIHLGTPDAPTPRAVRAYLREFLGDRRVLDLPDPGRWLLLHGAILPFRPRRSARSYQAIWTEQGSPLRVHAEALTRGLREALGPEIPVEHAMRYGAPSIQAGMARLLRQGAEIVVILPLFPQAAASATGTALAEAYRAAGAIWNAPPLEAVGAFYDHPGFLKAQAAIAREAIAPGVDHLLFSFHGLPERHLRKEREHCLSHEACCDGPAHANRGCYRAQCLATARAIAQELGWDPARTSASFQSRFGRDPWIRPSTDETLQALRARGVARLAVICPSFTTDCLETLEEIGQRARARFLAMGGTELQLVPSLNDHPRWIEGLKAILGPYLE